MESFKKMYNDFNYSYQKKLAPKTSVICEMPKPTGKARSVKCISWSASSDIEASATLCTNYNSPYAQWESLKDNAQVSPSITAVKFNNPTTFNRDAFMWVIME